MHDYTQSVYLCKTPEHMNVPVLGLAETSHFCYVGRMRKRHPDLSPVGSDHASAANRRARHPRYQRVQLRSEMAETIARFLIGYRQRRGLTQAQLGARLRMKESAISRLESGDHVPNADTLQRIQEGCSAEVTFAIAERTAAHSLALS